MIVAGKPILSIIIVNYHSTDLIINCIESVCRYNDCEKEIIIVNDDSTSDSHKIVDRCPFVTWIDIG